MEQYLSNILKRICAFFNLSYNGELRNACAAHIGFGWCLSLTLKQLTIYLVLLPIIYGVYRELEDCKFEISNWNNKNTLDIITWGLGCLIGSLI